MDKPLPDLYTDYLISSFGPTTATGLSRLLQAPISYDKITRFLSNKSYTSANLWQLDLGDRQQRRSDPQYPSG